METFKIIMTTTFYPPYHIGGDAVHVKYLAEELAKIGHEVHILHSYDAYTIKRGKLSKKMLPMDNVNIHMLKSPVGKLTPITTYFFGHSPFISNSFDSIQKRISPDIVHHHNISLLGHKLLKKKCDYINLYTAHDYWLICPRNDLLRNGKVICTKKTCFSCNILTKRIYPLWRYFKAYRKNLSEIDAIIAPSKHMKERLEQEIDVNITQISNFVPNPPKMSNKPKFDDYLLYVGVLETHKGIKLLLNAFKDNQIKEKLVIIGKGTLEDYIEKFIKENRLENKINLLKWVDNDTLWNMYADAMAVVMPSTWEENAPLVALEALSVGTPVIGSEIGGIPEIIKKVDDQLILRSFPADLISAMKFLENREFSSSSIKEIWNKYYSPSAYIKEYNKLISRFDGARR